MGKNRYMAEKHRKAKKFVMQEVREREMNAMCCTHVVVSTDFINNYIDYKSAFFSDYGLQRRVDALVGRHYPAEKFREEWNAVYEYLTTHTVPEAKKYFGEGIIALI